MSALKGAKPRRTPSRGLGKGLGSLLGGEDAGPQECAIDAVNPNPEQPRVRFDEEKLQELSKSIERHGILLPLLVRERRPGQYQLIAGERRLRAARLAGLTRVPIQIQRIEEAEVFELALIENIQRADLDPVEEAEAYQQLLDELSLSQNALAERLGKRRATVAGRLQLLKLDETVQEQVRSGALSAGHGRLLAPHPPALQVELSREVITKGWSVRELERAISARAEGHAPSPQAPSPRIALSPLSSSTQRQLERAQRRWGAKLQLREGAKGRELRLHLSDEGELAELLQLMSALPMEER